jgi:hypothetical protein
MYCSFHSLAVLKEALRNEVYLLLAVLFYIGFVIYGKYYNSKKANAW